MTMHRSSRRFARWIAAACAAAIAWVAPAAHAQCGGSSGSCLEPHAGSGCSDATCCTTVCDLDPLCCSEAWTSACVALAEKYCQGLCGAQVSGNCRTAHANPGCNDEACCTTVCASDPSCCSVTWDATCAFQAEAFCKGGNPVECGLPGQESCIAPHASPGCEYADCCKSVCGIDPSCCSVSWDVVCAQLGITYCSGCNVTCPPESLPEPESCGERLNDPCAVAGQQPTLLSVNVPVCGSFDAEITSGGWVGDRDVYRLNVVDTNGDGLVRVSLRLASTARAFVALVRPGCPITLAGALLHAQSNNCVEATESACVAPGQYWVVFSQGTFPVPGSEIMPCVAEPRYTLLAEFAEDGCATSCSPDAGSCFDPHPGAGCDDPQCCAVICATDPFCCSDTWDQDCANRAGQSCDFPPPVNDTCATALPIGPGETIDFSTLLATIGSPSLPSSCTGSTSTAIGPDVWFSYNAERRGTIGIDTCGSSIDTRIAVYSGTCTSLTLVACASSSPLCTQNTSAARLNFTAVCGTRYFIRIGGENASVAGSARIKLIASGPICPGYCPEDLTRDGSVNGQDLGVLLGNWARIGTGDLNLDGTVNGQDLGILLGAWGDCPPQP
jgi:hypothetical protein